MAKILIIDDDPALRGTMRKILERSGHDVSEAGDGDAGLRQVAAEAPDLVITDLLMPEKEGIETIQELTEHFPDVRILAVSGAGGTEEEEGPLMDAKLFGAHAVLPKPFSVQVLTDTVAQLLG
ncbi:MAG: response regulator [Gemmatimonadales bacterium]|nr:MAG: response regulator [Gemmatimonadales bacterium]